jgi:ABC-type Fe3+-hydroxamate transport system substrate-binding protein
MPIRKDQTGRDIEIPSNPQRIISIVPSQTELLFDLGLGEEVIGITKFCIHPDEWFRNKTRIGGTKTLNLEKIRQLKPDLIIANKEENTKEQVEELAKEFPVWTSNIQTLDEALDMIQSVGNIVGKNEKAIELVQQICAKFDDLKKINSNPAKPKAAYLIWKDPYLSVGGDSFINDMMKYAGFENVFQTLKRYPEIQLEDLKNNCDVVLLSSEPFPFAQKHLTEIQEMVSNVKIILVDGEMFSWYGSRLLLAPDYFMELNNKILHS